MTTTKIKKEEKEETFGQELSRLFWWSVIIAVIIFVIVAINSENSNHFESGDTVVTTEDTTGFLKTDTSTLENYLAYSKANDVDGLNTMAMMGEIRNIPQGTKATVLGVNVGRELRFTKISINGEEWYVFTDSLKRANGNQ